jgi:hypothetical protein
MAKMMNALFKPAGLILALFVLCVAPVGCSGNRTVQTDGDRLWANGELRAIICFQHSVPNAHQGSGYSEESDHLERADFGLFEFPVPDQAGHRIAKDKFTHRKPQNDMALHDEFMSLRLVNMQGVTLHEQKMMGQRGIRGGAALGSVAPRSIVPAPGIFADDPRPRSFALELRVEYGAENRAAAANL